MPRLSAYFCAAAVIAAVAIAGCGSAAITTSTVTRTPLPASATPTAAATAPPKPRRQPKRRARYCEDRTCVNLPATTSHRPAAPAVDCLRDGTGGGIYIATLNRGAGGCQYGIDVSQWCDVPDDRYEAVSPPGTFLVEASNDGSGFGTFAWSDGVRSMERVCP